MSGLLTYRDENRQTSQLCGFGVRQAYIQGYLTNANVIAATTVQNLIDNVNAAVVSPGAADPSQRQSIVRCLQEGAALGDFSDSRIAAATSAYDLANATWASDTPNDYMGVNLTP